MEGKWEEAVMETAKLIQDFTGGYHIQYKGKIVVFSVTLAEALEWGKKNKIKIF